MPDAKKWNYKSEKWYNMNNTCQTCIYFLWCFEYNELQNICLHETNFSFHWHYKITEDKTKKHFQEVPTKISRIKIE